MAASVAKNETAGFFEHGGRVDLAAALYPDAPLPWIDLSTGISPWPYPMPSIASDGWWALPALPALQSLLAAARKAYRVPEAASVVALPGSETGINTLPWLFREAKRVAILGSTYSSHAKAWGSGWAFGLEDRSAIRGRQRRDYRRRHPDNPTGRVLTHAELAAAVGPLRRKNGLLVVDEAFADEDDALSILPKVARLDHTLVFRSLGKFYGAAGVRLGFAVTSHPVADRLRGAIGAWPLSAAALCFGKAALADDEWKNAHQARLKAAARELDEILAGAGLAVSGGTSLFRLAGVEASHEIFAKLARHGILTRPFDYRSALRFGLPKDAAETARLRNALHTEL